MNRQLYLHWLGFGSLLILLSGCGFHLKGYQQAVPQLDGLFVEQGERRDSLAGVIRHELSASGTKLAASANQARYRLRISQEKTDQRVMAVDASGRALEYELRLQARFLVSYSDGTEYLPEQHMELLRHLSFGGDDELGQRNEADLMRIDMRLDMADRIIRRLQAQLQ